jgi:type IV secretion system protein VirD4
MWQSVGQIEKTWGKDGKKSWYASAGWRLYAAINDEETAIEVSKRCGTYTVLTHSEGTSTSLQSATSNGGRTRGYSGNVSERQHELLSPYQAQTSLSPDEAILIPKGCRAARVGRPMYFRRPEMAALVAVDQFRRVPAKEAV